MEIEMLDYPPARSVWITRSLLNAEELAEWAQAEGFDDLVPSVWHVSVIKADPETKLDLAPSPSMLPRTARCCVWAS
jgi:hypothetical protein